MSRPRILWTAAALLMLGLAASMWAQVSSPPAVESAPAPAPAAAPLAPAAPSEPPVPLAPLAETKPTTQPGETQPADTQPDDQAAELELEPEPPSVALPDGRVLLNFRNTSLEAVLDFLAQATGIVVINDVQPTGRVNLISRHPLTLDEAIEVLSSVLKDKGYAAVRTGRTLRIVALDVAKKSNIPVQSGSNPQDLGESDRVITQVIPVRFADAAQLKRDLANLIPSYADMQANVSTNTLILTDTEANVRRVMQIIRALDTAVAAVTQVKVFTLKYANAANAARLITSVFQQEPPATAQGQRGAQVAAGFRRFFAGGGPGGGAGAGDTGEESGRPQARISAAADDRTNTIVVSAPAETMPVIEEVLKQLDANPAQDQAVFIYYMRNAQAINAEIVVNDVFNAGSGTGSGGRATTTPVQRGSTGLSQSATPSAAYGNRARTTSGGLGASAMNLNQIGPAGTPSGASAARTTTTAVRTAAPALSTGAAQSVSALAGQVYAVADPDTNSLLIMTSSANFERVKQVLDELDRPVPQVLIKALLAEVTHTNDIDLGVEFSAINLKTSGDTTVFTDFGVAAATGGLVGKLVETDVTVAIRMLEEVGKIDVLSRPYVLTSDNQTASIIVGQQVPFITDTRITETGQTINTIQYQDIGIILSVTPHINPDGLVVMDVSPEISALTNSTVPISETVNAPVISKRAAQMRVAIHDGQTIVIGGLMQDQKDQTVRKVPFVGDIPLLGLLFQRNQTIKTKTELLIFLTPHVAQAPNLLKKMSEQERLGAQVVPTAVGKGVFQEHLEGMQRGGMRPELEEPTLARPATTPPAKDDASPRLEPEELQPK